LTFIVPDNPNPVSVDEVQTSSITLSWPQIKGKRHHSSISSLLSGQIYQIVPLESSGAFKLKVKLFEKIFGDTKLFDSQNSLNIVWRNNFSPSNLFIRDRKQLIIPAWVT